MALDLLDLDDEARQQMSAELEDDIAANRVFLSPRLTPLGRQRYPDLLRYAVRTGNDTSLANALDRPGLLKQVETAVRRGRAYNKRVPYNAAVMLAEGEFNRYYIRAVCIGALAFGGTHVQVYRARPSRSPRPRSNAVIGRLVDARALLSDLRTHMGVETALKLPEVNSGLSVRHVRIAD